MHNLFLVDQEACQKLRTDAKCRMSKNYKLLMPVGYFFCVTLEIDGKIKYEHIAAWVSCVFCHLFAWYFEHLTSKRQIDPLLATLAY